jgi:GntR family transcriptional regulator, transcriptional repressor for pyruvate dehydrogenase complex
VGSQQSNLILETVGVQPGSGAAWPDIGENGSDSGDVPGPGSDFQPGDLAAPLNLKRTSEHLVERLVTALALGSYVVGQKLPSERELAPELRVSRATLRDALHQMERRGYIEIRRGRHGGAYVRSGWGADSLDLVRKALSPRWERLEWTFDLSNLLNPLIARLAAERRTAEDLEALAIAVARYAQAVEAADRTALRLADHAIHAAIARASHNPYLVTIEKQMRSELSLGTDALPTSPEIRARALRDHQDLAQAIAEQDGARAAEIALQHMQTLAEQPLRTLYERSRMPDAAPAPS